MDSVQGSNTGSNEHRDSHEPFFRLLLVRHGESVANLSAETLITGQSNETPLTQKGVLS